MERGEGILEVSRRRYTRARSGRIAGAQTNPESRRAGGDCSPTLRRTYPGETSQLSDLAGKESKIEVGSGLAIFRGSVGRHISRGKRRVQHERKCAGRIWRKRFNCG